MSHAAHPLMSGSTFDNTTRDVVKAGLEELHDMFAVQVKPYWKKHGDNMAGRPSLARLLRSALQCRVEEERCCSDN